MAMLEIIRQINWQDENKKRIGQQLMIDATEYLKVEKLKLKTIILR